MSSAQEQETEKCVAAKPLLYVSLTAIPQRSGCLAQVLLALTTGQTRQPDRVFVAIPKSYTRWPSLQYDLPGLKDLIPQDKFPTVTLLQGPDRGPATKILSLLRYLRKRDTKDQKQKEQKTSPNVRIVFVDDDRVYDHDLLERLETASIQRPGQVICGNTAFLSPEVTKQYEEGKGNPGFVDTFVGSCGVLVTPEMFADESLETPPSDFIYVDDIWLSGILTKNKHPIWCIAAKDQHRTWHDPLVDLVHTTDRARLNLACISYFHDKYGLWKDLYLKEKHKQKQFGTYIPCSMARTRTSGGEHESKKEEVKLKELAATKIFSKIYKSQDPRTIWEGGSGLGSRLDNCWQYMVHLHNILRAFRVESVLDLGCGDWQFSRLMDWTGINYTGVDCFQDMIKSNTEKYSQSGISFMTGDLFDQAVIQCFPEKGVDLVILKDVLAHWPTQDIATFLPLWQTRARKAVMIVTDLCEGPPSSSSSDIELGDYRPLDIKSEPLSRFPLRFYSSFMSHHQKHIFLWETPAAATTTPTTAAPRALEDQKKKDIEKEHKIDSYPLEKPKSYSQGAQDRFVQFLSTHFAKSSSPRAKTQKERSKTKGWFLDVGCGHPYQDNNTYLLEKSGWQGLSIDCAPGYQAVWKESKRRTRFHCADALTLDYEELLRTSEIPPLLDYLSLDTDEHQLKLVRDVFPWDKIKFKIATIEHDAYRFGEMTRRTIRETLLGHGYEIACADISDGTLVWEDWYFNPEFISFPEELQRKFGSSSTHYEEIIRELEQYI